MKIVLASLALATGFALAGSALAADRVATGKPTQLAQQAPQKAKRAKKNVRRSTARPNRPGVAPAASPRNGL